MQIIETTYSLIAGYIVLSIRLSLSKLMKMLGGCEMENVCEVNLKE